MRPEKQVIVDDLKGSVAKSPYVMLSDYTGLTVQNFMSAAIGLCTLAVLVRGFARQDCPTVGNFWQDLARGTFALLMPLATIVALLLAWQGAAQSLATTAAASSAAMRSSS